MLKCKKLLLASFARSPPVVPMHTVSRVESGVALHRVRVHEVNDNEARPSVPQTSEYSRVEGLELHVHLAACHRLTNACGLWSY